MICTLIILVVFSIVTIAAILEIVHQLDRWTNHKDTAKLASRTADQKPRHYSTLTRRPTK